MVAEEQQRNSRHENCPRGEARCRQARDWLRHVDLIMGPGSGTISAIHHEGHEGHEDPPSFKIRFVLSALRVFVFFVFHHKRGLPHRGPPVVAPSIFRRTSPLAQGLDGFDNLLYITIRLDSQTVIHIDT